MSLRTTIAVASRFRVLLERTALRTTDTTTYEGHRISVTKRLQKSFAVNRVEAIGSHARKTSVRDVSDIDLMLILSVNEVKWGNYWKSSDTVLKNVRNQLQDRYTATEVGRDGQAVVVQFADGKYPVDIVPAVYVGSSPIRFIGNEIKNYPVFEIPDGEGDWMPTSPQAHTKYLNAQNLRTQGKLYNTTKLIKYWRSCRLPNIPLNSFHLELLLAQEEICVGAKTYAMCLYKALALLNRRECRALQDPLGVSRLVKASNTEAKREKTQAAIAYSADHARRALVATGEGKTVEAVRQWDVVFNGHFPK